MADGLATYVYCVVPGDARLALDGLRGVDGARPIETVRQGDLIAVTCRVTLDEFGAEPLKRNLNDVAWLERTARAHEAVLDRALSGGGVVPLRLCTVYHDDAAVRAMLEREHEPLAAALDRLRRRTEWGVKLIADPDAPPPVRSEPGEAAPQRGAPGAGAAFLARKRRDRLARADTQRLTHEAARAIHARLREQAAAATILRPPPRELSPDAGELVLNGAYLVDTARAGEFRALATELGERHAASGLRVEVTGPWPPYSFVADRAR
jgi:gas vesicle protein GvpL/GvpF